MVNSNKSPSRIPERGGNPSREDLIAAGTGIRIPGKRCIAIIDEVIAVCGTELDKALLKALTSRSH